MPSERPSGLTPVTRHERPNPFAALRQRDFRLIWSSEMLHLWGTEMENLVLAWFILSDTGSPLQVGLIGATRFGGTLLAPLYGAVVDRFDRRKVQIFARSVSALLAAVLMTLVLTDLFVAWHAFAIVGLSSLVRMLGIVVNQALSADAVPASQINNAMGLNRATTDLARIIGSLMGGGLMSALGLGPAYVGVVALYVAATLAATLVSRRAAPLPEPPLHTAPGAGTSRGYYSQIAEGVSYVRGHSLLVGLLFFAFLIEFTAFPLVNELMTVMGDKLFGTNENGVGVMRATASGGALLGALVTGAYPGIANPGRLLVITVVAWHLLTLPLAFHVSFGMVLPLLFVWGIFAGASFVALMVALLKAAPVQLRGRVMGLRVLAIYGLPLGLLMGGWLAEEFGVRTMIRVHGVLGLGLALAAVAIWPALWKGDRSAEDHSRPE
ncbi:MAG: MFS transporter [Chloroflexi bacterium]|nr:MFS transporter [Chloroflexota bacterium]